MCLSPICEPAVRYDNNAPRPLLCVLLRALYTSSIAAMLCVCCCFGADGEAAANSLIVYGPVPGLSSSEHFAVRKKGDSHQISVRSVDLTHPNHPCCPYLVAVTFSFCHLFLF